MTYNSVKWANGSALRRDLSVGPAHDPYARTVINITLPTGDYEIMECALAGLQFKRNGVQIDVCHPISETRNSSREFSKTVEAYTGFDMHFWIDKLWRKLDDLRYEEWGDMYYDDGIYGGA